MGTRRMYDVKYTIYELIGVIGLDQYRCLSVGFRCWEVEAGYGELSLMVGRS